MQSQENFYQYQQRRLGILLTWGLGSVFVGLLTFFKRNTFWRQFGLQACAWGAIDAAIALFGLRSATRKGERLLQGELTIADEQREAQMFQQILLVNTVLDGGYVLAGIWVTQRFKQRDRRGMGLGIVLQGVWLLLYDGFLTWEVDQRLKK